MSYFPALALEALFDSPEEGLRHFNTPKGVDGNPLPGTWMRVDGLCYIGSDTALFHIITPLPSLAYHFSVHADRVTAVGGNGEVFISRYGPQSEANLQINGYNKGAVKPLFITGETLVEPNPRGATASDFARL